MQKNRMRKADAYVARHRRHGLWQKIVGGMACVVVFGTTYALILPAITMEKYDCGLEEHTHTEACYTKVATTRQQPVCTPESLGLHTHGEDCYDENGVLRCGYADFVVHQHDAACYSADGELWCQLPEIKVHAHDENCYDSQGNLTCDQPEIALHTHDESCYDEQGTLTCGLPEVQEHVHSDACFQTVEVDTDELTCGQEESEEHQHSALCYGNWELTCGIEEHTHTEECATIQTPEEPAAPAEVPISMDAGFENDYISAVFHIEGTVILPETDTEEQAEDDDAAEEAEQPAEEEAAAEPEATTPVLTVTELGEDQEVYQRIANAAQSDDLIDLSVLQAEAYCGEEKLDLNNCTITAEVTPTVQLMDILQTATLQLDEDVAPEAEMGILLSALEEDGITEQTSTFVVPETQDMPVLTATVGDDGIMTVSVSQAANPTFTVQYYAYWDDVAETGANTIDTIIDTSKGDSNMTGGTLPTNGTDPKTTSIALEDAGNGKYKVATEEILTEVYRNKDYEYFKAPSLNYFNQLSGNGNYDLKEVWILQEGKDGKSIDPNDWTRYNASVIHFTNRENSTAANTVQIKDGMVLRLVYDTAESTYINAVNFYDYDITDDGINTEQHGINSAANYKNYSEGQTKLAFGNANTGTGMQDLTWNGNNLNRYNSKGYRGCTFGLVTGLADGKLQYAPGVAAPDLFSEGAALGKASYTEGQYTLTFDRDGDTYTLASVNGTNGITAGELGCFNHPGLPGETPYTHIWTNNFWPMDSETNKDPHTGYYNDRKSFIGADGVETLYPLSDDGLAHNSMFGMQYSVKFKLTPEYIGPLEYYFFGDDDMWVFLDGQLVCDIGGVHSSVGAYVDLWDYLSRDTDDKEHTLSFYYTERGLSGSTCYMRFTLPSVTSATPGQSSGALKIGKKVEGVVTADEEFQFNLTLTDESGSKLQDAYAYTRFNAEDNVIEQNVIDPDDGTFVLKADEYIIVYYLPQGARFTVTENNAPYYSVAYQIDNGAKTDGNKAGGSITAGNTAGVLFTNTAKPMLPETGGTGTAPYTTGGILTVLCAGMLLFYKEKKRRKEERASS